MTADRLATLQRRAAADPGDVQAQAAWLRARVQAGERGPVACDHGGPGPQFVRCSLCGLQKCPWGLDAGVESYGAFCEPGECAGYTGEPRASSLWPGEEPDAALCRRCNGTGLAPFRRSVELAAYCGHAGARLVAGGCPACGGDCGASGLVQPPRVDGYVQGCMACGAVRQWPRRLPQFPDWLRGLARWGDEVMVREADAAFALPNQSAPIQAYTDEDALLQLASEVGEQPVREAIQRALIAWALGPKEER